MISKYITKIIFYFCEPHPFPERGSPTGLCTSGQTR